MRTAPRGGLSASFLLEARVAPRLGETWTEVSTSESDDEFSDDDDIRLVVRRETNAVWLRDRKTFFRDLESERSRKAVKDGV